MAEDAWIVGTELAKEALPIFGSAAELKEWLILRLGKGRIAARAQTTVIRASASAPAHRLDDWAIPPSAWTFISLAADGPYRITLSDDLERLAGPFPPGVEGQPYAQRQFECRGLTFFRRDLSAIFDPVPIKHIAQSPRGGIGGARPDKARWTEFAAAFAVTADANDIDPLVDAATIYDEVTGYLAEHEITNCLSIDSVRDSITLAQAWKSGVRIKPERPPKRSSKAVSPSSSELLRDRSSQ
jgi:hypothetical protein